MAKLTGAPTSVLGRIQKGHESETYRAHMAVVAAFCRELREALVDITGRPEPTKGSMRSWLHAGKVQTTHNGVRTPMSALSRPEWAVEALDELRNATG